MEEKIDALPTDRETKTILSVRMDYSKAAAMQAIDEEVIKRLLILRKPIDGRTIWERNFVENFEIAENLLVRIIEGIPSSFRKYSENTCW